MVPQGSVVYPGLCLNKASTLMGGKESVVRKLEKKEKEHFQRHRPQDTFKSISMPHTANVQVYSITLSYIHI